MFSKNAVEKNLCTGLFIEFGEHDFRLPNSLSPHRYSTDDPKTKPLVPDDVTALSGNKETLSGHRHN